MMGDGKIHIWAKRITLNEQGTIKLKPEAYSALAEVASESGKSIRSVASEIILQSIEEELIVYDREDE